MRRLFFLLALLASGPGVAQDSDTGRAHYLEYCAACHGLKHDGQGPMAGVMVIKPANLATLKSENDGVFPLERVIKRIDGRDPLVSHGSPMPVYGRFFEGGAAAMKTASGQQMMTSRAIADLVTYLIEVQK